MLRIAPSAKDKDKTMPKMPMMKMGMNMEEEEPETVIESDSEAEPMSEKISKDAVRYTGGESSCSGCVHFQNNDGSCEIVEGDIDPDGICILFEPSGPEATMEEADLDEDEDISQEETLDE